MQVLASWGFGLPVERVSSLGLTVSTLQAFCSRIAGLRGLVD